MTRIVVGITAHVTAEAFLRPQLTEMVARGWNVDLVTSSVPLQSVLRTMQGVTIHEIAMSRRFTPFQDLVATFRWNRLLRAIQPDLLLVSTPKAALIGLLAGKSRGVKSRIYHVRGLRLEGMSGWRAQISRLAEAASLRFATSIVCDSESLLAELHARGLIAPDNGTVLGAGSACGVDTSKFKPALISSSDVRAQRPTRVTIGFVGRICADKGVPELIQAVAELRECGIDARLLLVGELEEPSVMEPWLGRDGAADWISIEGWRDDLPAVMRDMDVFCLPSHREGMPISILEAMATGLPVVTTTATGCRDLVVNGMNGLLVPIDDVDALTRGLTLLAGDPNLRHQWGASGRAIVERDFESARVNARFVDFLAQELGIACEVENGRGA